MPARPLHQKPRKPRPSSQEITNCEECPFIEHVVPVGRHLVSLYCRAPRPNVPDVHYTGPGHAYALIVDPTTKQPPFCRFPLTLSFVPPKRTRRRP